MKREGWATGTGAISLVLIFAVLCLSVFAVLSLSTANSERIMAQRIAQSAKDYYAADARAVEILAMLKTSYKSDGKLPTALDETQVDVQVEGRCTYASYGCPLNDAQTLFVKLVFDREDVSVLSWKTVLTEQWDPDSGLNVWQPDEEATD
jgi:hypothetical protein